MATAPTSRKLNLTRDQLSQFLTDQQQIRQFELLFAAVDELQVIVGTDFEYQADTAAATANEALAQVSALAQDTAVDQAVLNAKVQQALDAVSQLARTLELIATAPAIENNNSVVTDYIDFNTTTPSPAVKVGRMHWNGGYTLNLEMTPNVNQAIGESQYYYIKASAAIAKGQLVMFDGSVGASGVLKGKPSTGVTNGQLIMGVAAEAIANNGFGLVSSFGLVRGFNTTGTPYGEVWADGDILYYNPSFAGGLTKNLPTAPIPHIVVAAVVNAATAGSGSVFVRVQAEPLVSQLSDVYAPTPANGDVLVYDSAQQRWENAPVSTAGAVTSVTGTSPVVSSGGTTPAISLASGYGDTQNPYAAKTANYVLAAPNGSSGAPTFRALVAADIPALSYVSSIGVTAPITSTGGLTPTIGITQSGAASNGYLSSTDWNTFNNKQPAGTYVTAVSVVSANGLAGTSSGGATPALTLSTTITGLLKGNGTAISAATSGTDYAPATSGTSILYGNGSGGFSNVTIGSGVSFSGGTLSATGSGGTVTSVAALTLGTTGTDLSSTVANGTTTPVITLNVPTASASNRGALSSTDWSTFNGKQAALVSGTNIKTVGGVSLLGAGDIGTLGTAYGGTGLTSFTANGIVYASSTSALNTSSALTFDGTNFATTGRSSAASFVPTSSTVPTNGMFGVTTVTFATNSTNRGGFALNGEFSLNTAINGGNLFSAVNSDANGYGVSILIGNQNTSNRFIEGYSLSASSQNLAIYTDGNVRIKAGSTYGNFSDRKLKTNIVDASPKLDDVMKLRVRNYSPIDDTSQKFIGFIAQEVEEVFPNLVIEQDDFIKEEKITIDEEGNEQTSFVDVPTGTKTKAIKESALISILIKAVQEQQEQIRKLQASIDAMTQKG
jgi:hypothetical protein